jgi:hypothetical protein
MTFSQRFSSWIRNDRVVLWFCFFTIFCYCIPYNILGENASLNINDNLDSLFVWYKIILDTDQIFSPNNEPVKLFMNGIPRSAFPSEMHFTFLWNLLLGPLGAYIFERWLLVTVAFFGMFVLLRKYIIQGKQYFFIQAGVALTFSLLPHWPFGGLSVPGLPFLLFAFLNLRSGDKSFRNWLIISIYPFYSSLILTGFFFMIVLLLIIGSDLQRKKKIESSYIYAFLLLGSLYILTHYRIFLTFFVERDFVSHRVEFIQPSYGLVGSAKYLFDRIYIGNQFILFAVTLAWILMWNYKQISSKFRLVSLFLLISAVLTSFIYSKYLGSITDFLFQIIPFNLERVTWLYPLLWSILFSISLVYIFKKLVIGKYLVVFLLFGQLIYDFSHHELVISAFSFKAGEKEGELVLTVDPSVKGFYAEKQFRQIAEYIGRDRSTYRVLSLGIHPSISQYNGFYTLDGYCPNYDRRYKWKFREIIKDEIEKNPEVKNYFDTWGSRAYLFTAQNIGYVNVSGNTIELKNLAFNTEAMKALGGRYIISAVKIDTQTDPEYKFLKKFQHKDSAWDIYLYEII